MQIADDTFAHLRRRLVREGDSQDRPVVLAREQQAHIIRCERIGLTRSR